MLPLNDVPKEEAAELDRAWEKSTQKIMEEYAEVWERLAHSKSGNGSNKGAETDSEAEVWDQVFDEVMEDYAEVWERLAQV